MEPLENIEKLIVGSYRRNISRVWPKYDEFKTFNFELKVLSRRSQAGASFRTVVNGYGTSQKVISKFLQRELENVHLKNSVTKNTNELIGLLDVHHGRPCTVPSTVVKYLCYSLESNSLMEAVEEALELSLVKFQSG